MGITGSTENFTYSINVNNNNRYVDTISKILPKVTDDIIVDYNNVIGKGAGGIVFRGRFNKNDVAVKCIYDTMDLVMLNDSVKRELAISRNLYHPNTVKTYGWVEVKYNGILLAGLIMDLYHDGSLYSLTSVNANISMSRKMYILECVCKGANYLHDCNIIHRDIKSLNVLIDGNKVSLSDYGHAREYNSIIMSNRIGTDIYNAPEVKTGLYTFSSDLYSLGVLTWEIATMTVPFPESNPCSKTNTCFDTIIEGLTNVDPNARDNMFTLRNKILYIKNK